MMTKMKKKGTKPCHGSNGYPAKGYSDAHSHRKETDKEAGEVDQMSLRPRRRVHLRKPRLRPAHRQRKDRHSSRSVQRDQQGSRRRRLSGTKSSRTRTATARMHVSEVAFLVSFHGPFTGELASDARRKKNLLAEQADGEHAQP